MDIYFTPWVILFYFIYAQIVPALAIWSSFSLAPMSFQQATNFFKEFSHFLAL